MKIISFLVVFFTCNFVFPGQDSGGTGEVHDAFIYQANKIIEFLKYDTDGKKIQSAYNLDLCRLYQTIDDDLIFVFDESNENNRDHRGSIIDAYSYNWHIHLPEKTWLGYFRTGVNVDHMIFKEMLRSEGTYLGNAVEISNLIRDIDIKRSLPTVNLDYVKARKKWTPESCLSSSELSKYKMIHDGLLNAVIDESPLCQSTNFTFEDIYTKADYLLKVEDRNQCKLKKAKCEFRVDEKNVNGKWLIFKKLLREGVEIAQSNITLVTNDEDIYFETEQFRCDKISDFGLRVLCEKYVRMQEKGICESSQIKRTINKIDNRAKITEHINLGLNIHPFYKEGVSKNQSTYVGKGSDIELLDTKIYKAHEIGALAPGYIDFVKVRLLSNTALNIDGKNIIFSNSLNWSVVNSSNIKLGVDNDIGYVMLTSTPWYYNKSVFGTKIERRVR